MAIGIGDVAAKAAMGRRIGRTQQRAAELHETVERRLHRLPGRDVVGEREGARSRGGRASRIPGQRRGEPGAEHQAVHLIEDDVGNLEYRLPAEALGIEAARARQVGDAERDHGDLLLHACHHRQARSQPPV
jgi:hypothetical protein